MRGSCRARRAAAGRARAKLPLRNGETPGLTSGADDRYPGPLYSPPGCSRPLA